MTCRRSGNEAAAMKVKDQNIKLYLVFGLVELKTRLRQESHLDEFRFLVLLVQAGFYVRHVLVLRDWFILSDGLKSKGFLVPWNEDDTVGSHAGKLEL